MCMQNVIDSSAVDKIGQEVSFAVQLEERLGPTKQELTKHTTTAHWLQSRRSYCHNR